MATVLVLNGPNVNLLGTREPGIYGVQTLADVERMCKDTAGELGLELDFRQSNHEGELIDWIQEAGLAVSAGGCIGVVLNPGALTHTSLALQDAITGAQVPGRRGAHLQRARPRGVPTALVHLTGGRRDRRRLRRNWVRSRDSRPLRDHSVVAR